MVLDMGSAHGLLLLPSLPAVLSLGGDKGMCNAENNACWKMGARGHLMENRSRLTGCPGRSSAYILGEACTHRKAVASRSRSRPAFLKSVFPAKIKSSSEVSGDRVRCPVDYLLNTQRRSGSRGHV